MLIIFKFFTCETTITQQIKNRGRFKHLIKI